MRIGRMKTLFGFFTLPIISMGVSLISIPVLISTGGTDAWAAIAIAQGVGATAALIVTFGWGTVGPAQVARSVGAAQKHLYWLSVVMRSTLAVVALPIAAVVTAWLVSPQYVIVALVVCAAITIQGLGPGWFLIGQGRPMILAAMEAGPRALAQLLSVVAVVATRDLIWYGVILLVMELAIAATAAGVLGARERRPDPAWRQVAGALKRQWPLALSALVGSGYTRAAVPIVSAVAYPSVAVFASIDKVQMVSRTGIRPLISFFQGWVVRGESRVDDRRPMLASAVTVGAGALVAGGIWALLPTFGSVVFTDAISITSTQAGLLGATVLFVSASYSTGLYYLVPRGAIKVLSSSSVLGSLTGIPMLFFFSHSMGATGAILAVAAAELLVVLWQGSYLLATRNKGPKA